MVGETNPRPQDVQATFCATLVDTWIRLGVRHAVISPGSRSTPMALALTDRGEIAVHVVHDERSAAFVALGLGIDGVPALLLCTSGTAAANFYPAVVEAGLSEVPMIVLTADRPEEFSAVSAPRRPSTRSISTATTSAGHATPVSPTTASAPCGASWRGMPGRMPPSGPFSSIWRSASRSSACPGRFPIRAPIRPSLTVTSDHEERARGPGAGRPGVRAGSHPRGRPERGRPAGCCRPPSRDRLADPRRSGLRHARPRRRRHDGRRPAARRVVRRRLSSPTS